jgi:signal transduction histidine kinase
MRPSVKQRWIPALCVALLCAAWIVDLITPQLWVVAILLDIPIVLSTFAGQRRLTTILIVLALAANAIAGYVNGVQAGYHWDAVAIVDRLLAALSIVLVGALGLWSHRIGARGGESAAREAQARREVALRRAIEALRASMSGEIIQRAIVREAVTLFDAQSVAFYTFDQAGDIAARLSLRAGSNDIEVDNLRPPAEIISVLSRAKHERQAIAVDRGEPLGRLLLDRLGALSARFVPLTERDDVFGVLFLTRSTPQTIGESEDILLRAFADQAALALAQAATFAALAQKNEALAVRSGVIRDLVYALSHDLRTPLAAAGLTLRQARDGAYGPITLEYREILDRSVVANDELQRLAETLLLVARYESGEQSVRRDPLDVVALARDVVQQLEPLWSSRRIDVAVRAGAQPAVVMADASELRRGLVNLLANALTWTPEGGHVAISVEAEGNSVVVEIDDDGYGVPADIRPTLFARFGRSGAGSGTGLGLYIVRRIAEGLGGSVTYAPREPQGSRFTLRLPRAAARAEERAS